MVFAPPDMENADDVYTVTYPDPDVLLARIVNVVRACCPSVESRM
jgi:hypothetical protein